MCEWCVLNDKGMMNVTNSPALNLNTIILLTNLYSGLNKMITWYVMCSLTLVDLRVACLLLRTWIIIASVFILAITQKVMNRLRFKGGKI